MVESALVVCIIAKNVLVSLCHLAPQRHLLGLGSFLESSPHGHKSYSTSRQHILSFLLNSLLRNLICSHGFQRVNFQTYISNLILAAEIQTHLPTAYLISPLQNLRGVSNFIKVHLDSPKGRKCASLLKPTWS